MAYTPGEQVKRVQKLLETFEEKKEAAARTRAQLLSAEIACGVSVERIKKEAESKRAAAEAAFETLMRKIGADADEALCAARHQVDLLRGRFNMEMDVLSKVDTNLTAEFDKVVATVIEVRQVDPIEVSP